MNWNDSYTGYIPEGETEVECGAYKGRKRLEGIVIPNSVRIIGEQAFYKCSGLKKLEIPEGVSEIREMAFEDCVSLESVVIPDTVRIIGRRAFRGCTNLKNLVIPEGVVEIGNSAFSGCTLLETVCLSSTVRKIEEDAFFGCSSLAEIVVSSNNKIYRSEHNCLVSGTELIAVWKTSTIPDGITKIGSCALRGLDVQQIEIPDSVSVIGPSAFSSCKEITSLTLPDSISEIGYSAFWGCEKLESINIPNGIRYIAQSVFHGCRALKEITLPPTIEIISSDAFEDCENLSLITVPAGIRKIGYCCKNCWKVVLRIDGVPDYPYRAEDYAFGTFTGIEIEDISKLPAKFRKIAAITFAENSSDASNERRKTHLKYIKTNCGKLIEDAIAHPALMYLMCREKLIGAKDIEKYVEAVQSQNNAELTALILEYKNTNISAQDEAKVRRNEEKKEDLYFTQLAEKLSEKKTGPATFAVSGSLSILKNRNTVKALAERNGFVFTPSVSFKTDYLINNSKDSTTAKMNDARKYEVKIISEEEFCRMMIHMAEPEYIDFTQTVFVFNWNITAADKKRIKKLILQKGGIIRDNVSKNTRYLIIPDEINNFNSLVSAVLQRQAEGGSVEFISASLVEKIAQTSDTGTDVVQTKSDDSQAKNAAGKENGTKPKKKLTTKTEITIEVTDSAGHSHSGVLKSNSILSSVKMNMECSAESLLAADTAEKLFEEMIRNTDDDHREKVKQYAEKTLGRMKDDYPVRVKLIKIMRNPRVGITGWFSSKYGKPDIKRLSKKAIDGSPKNRDKNLREFEDYIKDVDISSPSWPEFCGRPKAVIQWQQMGLEKFAEAIAHNLSMDEYTEEILEIDLVTGKIEQSACYIPVGTDE